MQSINYGFLDVFPRYSGLLLLEERPTQADDFSHSAGGPGNAKPARAFHPTRNRGWRREKSDPDLGSSDTQTIYMLDLADLHVKKLLDRGGPNGNPKWSPDGKQIAYMTSNGHQFYYWANRYIGVASVDGGQPRIVTEHR